jgi:hypothetical protein
MATFSTDGSRNSLTQQIPSAPAKAVEKDVPTVIPPMATTGMSPAASLKS